MNKLILSAIVTLPILFNGCSDGKATEVTEKTAQKTPEVKESKIKRDQVYYDSHLDEAKKYLKDCKNEKKTAMDFKDKEAYKKALENKECNYANRAIQKQKREAEKKEREAEYERREAKFQKEYKEYNASLRTISFNDFHTIGEECNRYNYGGNPSTPKCKVHKELREQREIVEQERCIKEIKPEELQIAYGSTSINVKSMPCNKYIYDKAITQLIDDKKKYYDSHLQELKKDYNSCYDEWRSLLDDRKSVSELTRTFKCSIALKSAKKHFNVSSYGLNGRIK